MSRAFNTPTISVTIGHQTRLYHAFITTAPITHDAPSTLTLHDGPLSDIAGLAVEAMPLDAVAMRTPSRLVLVEATELGWQRARYREHEARFLPADPGFLGPNALQQWLWRRLQIPPSATAQADTRSLRTTSSRT